MSTKEFASTLVSDFEYLSHNFPSIVSIKPLRTNGSSQSFKVNYLQGNYRESAFHMATQHFTFNPQNTPSIQKVSDFPVLEPFIAAESISPSKNFRAIVRASPEKTLLEIWGKTGLLKSIRISDYHGVLYTDFELTIESLYWSQDEKRVVYLAEKKPGRQVRLFEQFNSDADAENALKNFRYTDDFGEMFKGKSSPALFVYDFEDDQLSQISNIPEDVTPTQVSFADKNGRSLIFCGYHPKEVKLGMKFTANRECKVYYLPKIALKVLKANPHKKTSGDDNGEASKAIIIGNDDISLSPIVSKDFTKVVYFFSTKKPTILLYFGVKVIDLTKVIASGEVSTKTEFEVSMDGKCDFLGVTTYQNRYTRARFLENSNYFVFNSYDRSSLGLFIANLETKEVKRIDKMKFKSGECRLDGVEGNTIFSSISNIAGERDFSIFSGINSSASKLEEALKDAKWHHYESNPEGSPQIENNLNASLSKLDIEETIIAIGDAESVLFTLKGAQNNKKPLFAFIHGGPHGISTGFFSLIYYYALYRGYNVMYINFTGSTGFGEKSLESLPGHVGEKDDADVKAVMDHCVKNGLADPKNLLLMGLSYGGFLTAVMLSKYPEMFRCGILQNPATSFINMYESSDVPDWSFTECVYPNNDFENPTAESIKRMFELSPLGRSMDIKSSVLFMLGEKDRRIPVGPSLLYYKLLKKKGVDVSLSYYPNDEHVLSGTPDSIADQFVKVFSFFNEKMAK